MLPGMMPTLHFPGEITPGQLGPMSLVCLPARNCLTRIISSVGMPSVMAITSGIPASAASMMASAAKGGGTKITETFAPVFRRASSTVFDDFDDLEFLLGQNRNRA